MVISPGPPFHPRALLCMPSYLSCEQRVKAARATARQKALQAKRQAALAAKRKVCSPLLLANCGGLAAVERKASANTCPSLRCAASTTKEGSAGDEIPVACLGLPRRNGHLTASKAGGCGGAVWGLCARVSRMTSYTYMWMHLPVLCV